MSPRVRLIAFLAAAVVLATLLIAGMRGLPEFGHYRGPYGDVINAVAVDERHVTNMATAVNFDYRAFDTLGEEYILFAAVTGLALLLRRRAARLKMNRPNTPPIAACRRTVTRCGPWDC